MIGGRFFFKFVPFLEYLNIIEQSHQSHYNAEPGRTGGMHEFPEMKAGLQGKTVISKG